MDEDVSGYFTPESQNAALIFLGRIIGCTMKALWSAGGGGGGNSCSDASDLVATLAKAFNLGALALIAIVATYLIFAAIKNTALDGEAGGRNTNPGWTLVGAALAAMLCIPLSGGFSALQIGVMQVAVWSSGFGDKIWSTSYDKMFSSGISKVALEEVGNPLGSEVDGLRASIAAGLKARALGEICSRELVAAVSQMGTVSGGTITSQGPSQMTGVPSGSTRRNLGLWYQAGSAFNNSTGLCGSVVAFYPASTGTQLQAPKSGVYGDESARDMLAKQLGEISRQVSERVANTVINGIQTQGKTIADAIAPSGSAVNLSADAISKISTAVDEIVRQATQTAEQEAQKRLSGSALGQMVDATRKDITQRGWMFAVLYQRVLANAVAAKQSIGDGVHLQATPPDKDLSGMLGCRREDSYRYYRDACSEVQEIFFANYQRISASYEQVDAAFTAAATNSPVTGGNATTDLPGLGASDGSLAWASKGIINFVTGIDNSQENGEGWIDPIPQIQSSGGTMMGVGTGMVAASAVADGITKIPVLGSISSAVTGSISAMLYPLGLFLFSVGFILAVIIPMLPLIYFFAAGVSWLISVCQAIFTAPFYLMQMFYPNTHGGLQNTGFGKMLLLLLGIIVRPALLVVGLLLCMVLMRAGLDIWNIFSRNSYATLASSAALESSPVSMTKIVLVLSTFIVYAFGAASLVLWCCQLISGLADAAMDALEAGASRLFSDSGRGQLESAIAGAAAGGITSRLTPRGTGGGLSGVRSAIQANRSERAGKAKSLEPPR